MIKYILFDIGGVLVDGSMRTFFQRVTEELDLEKPNTNAGPVIIDRRMHTGELSTKQVLAELYDLSITDPRSQMLVQLFAQTWQVRTNLFALLAKLKEQYTLCILSNSNDANQEYLQQSGLYEYFAHLFLSHEIGMLKPDQDIYLHVQHKLHAQPEELLFIDDQRRCLQTAEKLGWHTILYADAAQLLGALKHEDVL